VEALIHKGGADVKLPNKEGQTPLHIICLAQEEKLRSSRGMFGAGKGQAMVTILRNRPNINAQDVRGRTPLHYAVMCGERSYIKQLFKDLPNTDIRDAEGLTAEQLMIALAKADIEQFFASRYDSFG
jgi:ankyrin repeat protein